MKINRINKNNPFEYLSTVPNGECFELVNDSSNSAYLATDRYDNITETREVVNVETGQVCDFDVELPVILKCTEISFYS